MRQIPLGARGTSTLRVQPEHLADRFKDAILPPVFATPVMILIMENAALNAIRPFLDAGESAVGTAVDVQHFAATPAGREVPSAGELRRAPGAMASNLRQAVETRVIERFAPAHVVINPEGDILHYSPRTGKYLEAAPGIPNRQLVAMARSGLRLDITAARAVTYR